MRPTRLSALSIANNRCRPLVAYNTDVVKSELIPNFLEDVLPAL